MSEPVPCPHCKSTYTYELDNLLACPECGHEWDPAEEAKEDALVVKDANGNILKNGDTVVTIKNLPVRGTSQSVKAGTKVKNIRLVENNTEQIEGKIEGQTIVILTKYVRKQSS